MSRRRALLTGSVLAAAVLAVIGTTLAVRAKQSTEDGRGIWKLSTELVYDETLEESRAAMEQSGVASLLWKVQTNQMIQNADFERAITVDVMGVAGDTSLLFSESNSMTAGESDYCLLGVETARALFGSTHVNGRTVKIAGSSYQVAGVLYQQKNLCVYELDVRDGAHLDHVLFHFGSSDRRSITERMVQNIYGVSEYEQEKSPHNL